MPIRIHADSGRHQKQHFLPVFEHGSIGVSGKASFDKVGLLLVASKTQNYSSLRQTLTDLRFRDIRLGTSVEDISTALDTRPPDLLITDSDLPDGDVCELISDIRNSRAGSNPFLSIIVTTWDPSEALVGRVVDSGADDLLVQPTSRGALQSRIETLTFNRKPFVVTATYIGPDRRAMPSSDRTSVPALDVPNLLRAKATGESDTPALQRAIDAAIESVNVDKLARDAAHIGNLVTRIRTAHQAGKLDRDFLEHLDALLFTAQDMMRRLQGGTRYAPIAKLCQALITVAARMGEAFRNPDPRDVKLLPQLAMSVRLTLKDIDESSDAASKISDAVANPLSEALRA